MSTTLKWVTSAGSLGTIPENIPYNLDLETVSDTDVQYTLLSGNLPDGLFFATSGRIFGVPSLVSTDVTSVFVIRAQDETGKILDRTFSLTVQGQRPPVFITPPGRIGTFYDGSKVDVQVEFTDSDPDETLRVSLNGGSLPPGVTLSPDGRLTGFIEPFVRPSEQAGYDTTAYDKFDFDFSNNSITKTYVFTLEVTDGKESDIRTFEIFVYAIDAMSADNTNLTGDNTFVTADVFPERNPILTTVETDLGTIRANNYHAFKFDAIDFDNEPVAFILDGTIPSGFEFDSSTGWLQGFLPSQGAVERNFSFNIYVVKERSPFFEITLGQNPVINLFNGYYVSQGDSETTRNIPEGNIIGIPQSNKLLIQRTSSSTLEFDTDTTLRVRRIKKGSVESVTDLPDVEGYTENSDSLAGDLNTGEPNPHQSIQLRDGDGIGVIATLTIDDGKVTKATILNGGEQYNVGNTLTIDNYSLLRVHDTEYSYEEGNYVRFAQGIFRALQSVPEGIPISNSNFWLNLQELELHNPNLSYTQGDFVNSGGILYRALQNVPVGNAVSNTTFWEELFAIPSLENTELTFTINELDNGPVLGNLSVVSVERPFIKPREFDGENWVNVDPVEFKLRVIGDIDKFVTWLSPQNLGTVEAGKTSELATIAETSYAEPIFYRLNQGSLPPGTTLLSTGEIAGIFNGVGSTINLDSSLIKDYTFTVEAFTRDGFISTLRGFTITVDYSDLTPQQSIYIKAMPSREDRAFIESLLFNRDTIPPESIYRRNDPNFGVANSVIYEHVFGLNPETLDEYVDALSNNHYKKRIILGSIKTARATNRDGSIRYEVIYSEINDPSLNAANQSIPREITWPNPVTRQDGTVTRTLNPNSLINMRNRLFNTVGLRDFVLPDWMTSQQENGRSLGFVPAWVIAYVKPGEGEKLAFRIREFIGNNLNKVDFDIDRYTLSGTSTQFWDAEEQAWKEISSLGDVPYINDDSLDKQISFPNQTILG